MGVVMMLGLWSSIIKPNAKSYVLWTVEPDCFHYDSGSSMVIGVCGPLINGTVYNETRHCIIFWAWKGVCPSPLKLPFPTALGFCESAPMIVVCTCALSVSIPQQAVECCQSSVQSIVAS